MRINQDALGDRGEAIFRVLITEFDAATGPNFRPYFLGEKWPVVDFIVEILGAEASTPYFFVQVKTTRGGYTQKDKRLKVSVSEDDIRLLASYPAPTYVVGIDELARTVSAKPLPYTDPRPSTRLWPSNAVSKDAVSKELSKKLSCPL